MTTSCTTLTNCPVQIQIGTRLISKRAGTGRNISQPLEVDFKYFIGSTAEVIAIRPSLDPDEDYVTILFDKQGVEVTTKDKPIKPMVRAYNLKNLEEFLKDFDLAPST
jgi:hypothetical protein